MHEYIILLYRLVNYVLVNTPLLLIYCSTDDTTFTDIMLLEGSQDNILTTVDPYYYSSIRHDIYCTSDFGWTV